MQHGFRSPLSTDSAVTLTGFVDGAISSKGIYTFAFHEVLPGPHPLGFEYTTPKSDFETVCAYIRQKVDEGVLDCLIWYQLSF